MLQSDIILNLTSVSSIKNKIECGGISQMLKKLDYPTHAIFWEKTHFILNKKYLITLILLHNYYLVFVTCKNPSFEF